MKLFLWHMYNKYHKVVRAIVRWMDRHNTIYTRLRKYEWYQNLIYEEAQGLIGNRPWSDNKLKYIKKA